MKLKQLSLFLENKPGALSAPVKLLADAGINILTLSIAEARQYGILRLIVRDWEAAKRLLEKNGLAVKTSDVLAVEVADRPGGLAEILVALEEAGINLEYMYAFTLKRESKGAAPVPLRRPGQSHRRAEKEQDQCGRKRRTVQSAGRLNGPLRNIRKGLLWNKLNSGFGNDQFAGLCNIELLSVSPGRASARMTLHPHHLNGIGTVQGGAIFTLADFAFAAASNSHGTVAVAVNASITFMKAAGDGHALGRGAGSGQELQNRHLHGRNQGRPGRPGGALPGPGLPEEGQGVTLGYCPGANIR